MENDILLSIAIPTYNRADCLKNLLTNILPQAEKIEEGVQICISNNGSTDNTREVVMGFVEKYPGLIKYHENETNLGIDRNLLAIFKMADGQFNWTFGDDDIIVEGGIQEVVDLIKKHANEKTGLMFVREQQFFIDRQTKERVVCYDTVDKNKPKVFQIERKEILGLSFPDIAWISALIFNNQVVKKVLAQDRVDLEKGIGTVHAHLPMIMFMFLANPSLQALAFNHRALVHQELASYKSFIEDKFSVHYKVQKMLSRIFLSYKYIDKDTAVLVKNNDGKLAKAFILDMVAMRVFGIFKYISYISCMKLFFREANLKDALLFSFVFSGLRFIPTPLMMSVYKLFLMKKHGSQWRQKFKMTQEMVAIVSGGTRRRMVSDVAGLNDTKKNKKIIFFVPALDMGGAQRIISELSLHLPHAIEKIIVIFSPQASYPYQFNAKIISLDLPLNNALPLKIYYFFVGIMRLKKIIKKEKPDCVMSVCSAANIMNIFSCKQNILRIDNYSSSAEPAMYKMLAKILFKKASAFICASRVAAKDLVQNFGVEEKKIKVIYYSLNVKEILVLSQEPLEPEYQEIFNHPVIMNIGRFTSQKGQWYLIRVFKELKKTVKDAQLVILGGQGDLEQELKQMVLDMGIEKGVHFIGWQKNPFKFLAKAKVFALSSLWEGFPYATLEALACGLPIVSSDCKSGPREILAPKTDINQETKDIEYAEFGILTPAFSGKKYGLGEMLERNEEIFKDAIVKVLTNHQMASDLREKSRQRAQDFDISKTMKAWDFLNES